MAGNEDRKELITVRRRKLLAAVGAALLAIPGGYAIAQSAGLGSAPEPDVTEGAVPAESCGDEVRAAFKEQGFSPDAYGPACPSPAAAAQQAKYFNDLRAEGLEKIAESIRQYGGPDDAAQLEEIESELERLRAGG